MEVFDSNELLKTIDMVETTNEIITNYLDNNTWELMQEKKNKNNGVLKKSIEDNVNKSVIMESLNTLNNNNFDNSVNNIKSLRFNNIEEFKELVVLVFNKLKSTIKANKMFIARLLREYTKFEYDNIMKEYNQDKSNKILSAIVYLYQSSFFDLNIINIIIDDLKKEIEYNEETFNKENVENKIDMSCYLLDEITIDEKIEFIINNMIELLKTLPNLYGKSISTKFKIKIMNTIENR
jgi:hypothetical protein